MHNHGHGVHGTHPSGRAIVIMAKAPFPGEAKTRLAASLGEEAAAGLHRTFLAQSIETARGVSGFVALMCPDARHAALLRTLVPSGVRVWAQDRPGLMAGITQAFERAYAAGVVDVLVGEADSPNLPAGHLRTSFALLEGIKAGIVLGPCTDGGYYLVGGTGLAAGDARDLFEGPEYDGATICQHTCLRAREMGLEVGLAPPWYDVDTLEGLRRLALDIEGSGGAFPTLRAALQLIAHVLS